MAEDKCHTCLKSTLELLFKFFQSETVEMRRELWAVNSITFEGATQGFSHASTVMHPTLHANQRYSKQESVYAHTRGCHLFHKHH